MWLIYYYHINYDFCKYLFYLCTEICSNYVFVKKLYFIIVINLYIYILYYSSEIKNGFIQ